MTLLYWFNVFSLSSILRLITFWVCYTSACARFNAIDASRLSAIACSFFCKKASASFYKASLAWSSSIFSCWTRSASCLASLNLSGDGPPDKGLFFLVGLYIGVSHSFYVVLASIWLVSIAGGRLSILIFLRRYIIARLLEAYFLICYYYCLCF